VVNQPNRSAVGWVSLTIWWRYNQYLSHLFNQVRRLCLDHREAGWGHTKAQLLLEPRLIDNDRLLRLRGDEDLVGIFDSNFATVLGAEESSDYGASVVAEGVPGDVVGDCEES
jgi:hypothetical protein